MIADASCRRPWIPRINQERAGVDSYSARYLMLGQGYTVLKKWKIHKGPIFDRQVLIPYVPLFETWKKSNAQAVIPIPQHFFRAWQMRGSPVDTIAGWVSSQTQLPILKILETGSLPGSNKRQAQRTLGERLNSKKNRFTVTPSLRGIPKSVILIDDFMTTGRTLNEAAQTLKNRGVLNIHAFCLGVRTFNSSMTSNSP